METNGGANQQNFLEAETFSNKIPNSRNYGKNESSLVPFTQVNGRKVLGPPENWIGPIPSSACELFVRRIPKNLSEHVLLEQFMRFGQIYEIRVPVEYNSNNRGKHAASILYKRFAYVKYTNQEDAARAIEVSGIIRDAILDGSWGKIWLIVKASDFPLEQPVLSHFFISPGRKFEILYSYEKSRLFISNVPRHLRSEEIEETLRKLFPSMVRISLRSGTNLRNEEESSQDQSNRGHAFIHFANHMDALVAKKSIPPGALKLWNRDIKLVWADTEREGNIPPTTKTLFVRHVDFTVSNKDIVELLLPFVNRSSILKVTKVRSSAFIDFDNREAAEICMRELQGSNLRGQQLQIEWAKPSEKQSLHRMRNIDFDAMLRLKCMANGWSIPIILFGTYFHTEMVQYAAVVLRDNKGAVRAIYCILDCNDLTDIHSRLAEVVCALIETIGTFPDYNYTFMVEKENAHLLGMVVNDGQSVQFVSANGVPQEFKFDFNEIVDLSVAIVVLTGISEQFLLTLYHESFCSNKWANYLPNMLVYGHRVFGTILPKYRNKPPLNYHLNDTQIVLALCYLSTGSNHDIPSRPFVPFYCAAGPEADSQHMRYVILKLLPLAISQHNWANNQWISHIIYGENRFYHQAQRALQPPFYINGCSYAVSIKQPLPLRPIEELELSYANLNLNQTSFAANGEQNGPAYSQPLQHFVPQTFYPIYNQEANEQNAENII